MPPGVTTNDIPGQCERLIVTDYVRPPVPTTVYDWMAYVSGEEDGPTGRGPTECEALRDLCEQLAVLWLEA
jgi:hypothetical protein